MFNFQDVQREVGQQQPNRWEEIWNDLAVVDGHRGGVPREAIHWDCRTAARDGGRDIVIDRGAARAGAIFVPDRPSVWSVKSGQDGVLPTTLRDELDEKYHPQLVEQIKSGRMYIYCLCHPAGHDKRAALRKAADECCDALGVSKDSVKLLFDDHLCDGLKKYPGVLKQHCPKLGLSHGQTLNQWGRHRPHFDTKVSYVDIGDRRSLIDHLVVHLGSTAEPPILHVAGLSGIGKTRLVYEACRDKRVPESIMYFESYQECTELVRRLADDNSLSVQFVVDEVSFAEHFELRNKLQGFADRVRVISIGPAGKRDESRDTVAILQPPETESGVLAVLKHHAPATVPVSGLEQIAEQCGHDLRFALLMLDAVQRDHNLLASPGNLARALNNTRNLYERVITLFSGAVGLDSAFTNRYPWLTLGAHVGVKPPRGAELAFVARWASVPLIDLEKTLAQAIDCGLGDCPAHLFEAVPRGMATRIFADVLWPMIEPRFKELLAAAPDESFVRAIMTRVEQCPDGIKKEVTSRLDSHFHTQLGSPSITVLNNPNTSRTLRAWAELSPETGLPWLRRAIDNASFDELRSFEGSGRQGWGVSGPRRDVVWLLEHLACFAEHFATCEAMLFRLAVAENETIGNNATAIWSEKFRIWLSNTQVPYLERIKILLGRMAAASSDTMRLLMKGFVVAVTSPLSAMAPPPIVGGRLVPSEWRPVGLSIYDLFTGAIVEGLRVLSGLPEELQQVAREVITSEMVILYKKDTHDELVKFFAGPLDADERLRLSAALEGLRDRLQDDSDPKVVLLASDVSKWLEQVAPKDLAERIRLVVDRPLWSYDSGNSAEPDAWKQPYSEIVRELRATPDVLRRLTEWLDKFDGNGRWSFGWMLATEGKSTAFDEIITEWLRAGKCFEVCCGFLVVRRAAENALPVWAEQILDSLVESMPNQVAKTTVAVDPTQAGWARVRKCVARDRSALTETLGRMFGKEWESVLGPSGQAWVLDQLWPQAESREDVGGSTALHLFEMFRCEHKESSVPSELLLAARRLVYDPPNLRLGNCAYAWKVLALALAKTEPASIIAHAAKVALDYRTYQGIGNREAVGILRDLVGESDKVIIQAILATLAELPYAMPLVAQEFQELFAAMDPTIIAKAVDAIGVSAARSIGEFIPDPDVSNDGTAMLPALTEWFMSTYGDDEESFRQFCIGRWSGRVTTGWAWQRQSGIDRLVNAYANHPIGSLKRWVADVKRRHEAEVQRDRIMYEEDKRR